MKYLVVRICVAVNGLSKPAFVGLILALIVAPNFVAWNAVWQKKKVDTESLYSRTASLEKSFQSLSDEKNALLAAARRVDSHSGVQSAPQRSEVSPKLARAEFMLRSQEHLLAEVNAALQGIKKLEVESLKSQLSESGIAGSVNIKWLNLSLQLNGSYEAMKTLYNAMTDENSFWQIGHYKLSAAKSGKVIASFNIKTLVNVASKSTEQML